LLRLNPILKRIRFFVASLIGSFASRIEGPVIVSSFALTASSCRTTVYYPFTRRLGETAGAMKVADGFEPCAVIGPLIDMKAVEKVEAHIADTCRKASRW
jgi:hypothetical protein